MWGAHGSGKTHFLEELENRCFGRFLPVFGDLYGSKFKTEEKRKTLEEAYNLGHNLSIIMEGKRFIENVLLDTIGERSEEMKERGIHSILVIPVSSVKSSERRVNHRRSLRGTEGEFTYPERRAEYECQERFERKMVSLYHEKPLQWSNVDLRYFFVEDEKASWDPLINFFVEEFQKVEPITNPREVFKDSVALSHFWNSRMDTLYSKGQNYLDFQLGEEDYDSLRFTTPELENFEILLRKVRTPQTEGPAPLNQDEPSIEEGKETDMTDTKTEEKSEKKEEVAKAPEKKKTLDLIPTIPGSAVPKTALSKVRRGLKKQGLDLEKVTDAHLIVTVGAFNAQEVDPASKSSDWVGKNALPLVEGLISGDTAMPEGELPEVTGKSSGKKKEKKAEKKKAETEGEGEDNSSELDGEDPDGDENGEGEGEEGDPDGEEEEKD